MNSTAAKISLTTTLAILGGVTNALLAPFCVLCLLMCADYCTGLIKSWQAGTLSSRTGLCGLIKKLSYGLAIVAAAGVDFVMAYCLEITEKGFVYRPIFVLLIIAWFSVNECISILENLNETGVPLPGFLLKAAKKLKNEVEKVGEGEDKQDDDGNEQ